MRGAAVELAPASKKTMANENAWPFGGRAHFYLKIISNEVKQIFKENISFHSLGIGGLDTQFAEIFRRAFNSRRYP
jgi:hypothetical protein